MKIRIRLVDHGPSEPIPGLVWHDSKGGLYQAVIEEFRYPSRYELTWESKKFLMRAYPGYPENNWYPVEVVHEKKA